MANLKSTHPMVKDDILAALPALSRPELEAIQAVCTSLLGGRPAAFEPGAGTLAAGLLNALCAAVNAAVTPSNLIGTTTGKTFDKHLPAVGRFLGAHFKGYDDNKLVELAFLRLLADLLRDDLKERGVTPTIGILVTNLTRLPEVFDNAYPGYLAAGMGGFILDRLRSGQVPKEAPLARKRARRI